MPYLPCQLLGIAITPATAAFSAGDADRVVMEQVHKKLAESAFFFGKLIERERRFFGDPEHSDN